jgi:hypothetical protein
LRIPGKYSFIKILLLDSQTLDLPVTIGKGSNNDILQVDLKNLPHLFISYSEKEHINQFFVDLLSMLIRPDSLIKPQFACALSREMYSTINNYLKGAKLLSLFIRNETTDPAGGSKYLFMQRLKKELVRRQKIKQFPDKHPRSQLNPLIVIIDDIFDVIITKRKYTGTHFLELLAAGKELGIHFIAASIWTYRNLLSQLIKSKLRDNKAIDKQVTGKNFLTIQPSVAELIITPEDLYFFKESGQIDYTRYFPIREGVVRIE